MVRISGPTATPALAAAQRTQRSTQASGFAVTSEASDASETKAALGPSSVNHVASVGALLAMQEEDGPGARRRRMVRRAHGLLDQLDRVKLALLEGQIPLERLDQLVGMLQQEREDIDDPALSALLEQVEIRAEVERAKLEVARARQQQRGHSA